jgi:O-antigen ligase
MLAIYLILGVAVLVWGVIFALRGPLWFGGLLFVVAGFCFGRNLFYIPMGPYHPQTLDRLVLTLLMLAFGIQTWLGRTDPKPIAWFDVAMFLFAGVLTASALTGDLQEEEPGKYAAPIWRLVGGYLMPIAAFWIARQSRLDQRALRIIYGCLTLLGIYAVVTAIGEVTQQWWIVFPPYLSDPNVGIHFGRARGPTLQAQSMGFFLGVGLLCLWAWMPSWNRVGRLLLALLVPLFLLAIFFTYTRCVWIGAGLGVAIVVGLSLPGAWQRLALTAAAGGLLVATLSMDRLVSLERETGGDESRSSVESRRSFTYISWKMFLDHPLLGVGYGQYIPASQDYFSDRSVNLDLESIRSVNNHSTPLVLLSESGIVGAGLYFAMFAGWTLTGWRMWKSRAAPAWARRQGLLMLGLLGVYLGPALFYDMTYSPEDHWLLFFLAGVSMGVAQAMLPRPKVPLPKVSLPAAAAGLCSSGVPA